MVLILILMEAERSFRLKATSDMLFLIPSDR